jgi:hypothetical protein
MKIVKGKIELTDIEYMVLGLISILFIAVSQPLWFTSFIILSLVVILVKDSK